MRYEQRVFNHLNETGQQVSKVHRQGTGEDLKIVSPSGVKVILRAMNQKTMALSTWLNDVHSKIDDEVGAVAHKRIGKTDLDDDYVTMSVRDFRRLVSQ